MPNKRINQLVQELPFDKKLLSIGLVLMMVSQFMPWYQDKDSYSGDLFLGVTGPLSLIGVTLFVLSATGLGIIIAEALEKRLPFNIKRTSSFYLFFGLASFYLLLLAVTVYFHPKFGLNLTYKQSGFGMFFAFISASLITIGGYLVTRDRATLIKNFEEETRDPLEELSTMNLRKPKENLRTLKPSAQQSPVDKKAFLSQQALKEKVDSALQKTLLQDSPPEVKTANSFKGGQVYQKSDLVQPKLTASNNLKEAPVKKSEPQPYRMDL